MITPIEAASLRRSLAKYVERVQQDDDPENPTISPPDPGCVVCTHGVTPDRYNTGLCMYHQAERFLLILPRS